MEPLPGLTVVLEDDRGVILGTAKMGLNRPGAGAHIGTASFMVAPTAAGGAWAAPWRSSWSVAPRQRRPRHPVQRRRRDQC